MYDLNLMVAALTRTVESAGLQTDLGYPPWPQWPEEPVPDSNEDAYSLGSILATQGGLCHPLMLDFIGRPARASNAAAGVITGLVNPNLAGHAGGIAAHELERAHARRFAERMGWRTGGGLYATGGSQGNWLGLVCALTHVAGRDWRQHGLDGVGEVRVIHSDQTHASVRRATEIVGLGGERMVSVGCDSTGRIDLSQFSDLVAAAERAGAAIIAVANCGTSASGSIDDAAAMRQILTASGARFYLHCDASYGGVFLFSRLREALATQLGAADSAVIDLHKVIGMPYGTSVFLTRDEAMVARTFSPPGVASGELWALGPEESRPLRALPFELLVRQVGLAGLHAELDHLLDLATYTCDQIDRDGRLSYLTRPELTTVLVRTANDSRAQQQLSQKMLLELGIARVGSAQVGHQSWHRLCYANPRTQTQHVTYLLGLLGTEPM